MHFWCYATWLLIIILLIIVTMLEIQILTLKQRVEHLLLALVGLFLIAVGVCQTGLVSQVTNGQRREENGVPNHTDMFHSVFCFLGPHLQCELRARGALGRDSRREASHCLLPSQPS